MESLYSNVAKRVLLRLELVKKALQSLSGRVPHEKGQRANY